MEQKSTVTKFIPTYDANKISFKKLHETYQKCNKIGSRKLHKTGTLFLRYTTSKSE